MKKPLDEEAYNEVTVAARPESIPHVVDFVSSHARDMAFNETRIGLIRGRPGRSPRKHRPFCLPEGGRRDNG